MNEILKSMKGPGEGKAAAGGDDEEEEGSGRRRGGKSASDETDEEGTSRGNKKGTKAAEDSESDDSDDEADQENNDDLGNLKLSGGTRKEQDYENDEESADEAGEDIDGKGPDGTTDESSEDEEEGSDVEATADASTKSKAGAAKGKDKKTKKAAASKAGANLLSAFRRDTFNYNEEEGWAEVELSFHARARRLLMAQLSEQAAAATMVRSTKSITNAYAVDEEGQAAVVTEGVNFEALWAMREGLIKVNEIKSNDIWQLLCTYGVEAARHSIVAEIKNVFGVYGINVDPRHLSLIADFMTRNGSFTPLNRAGMNSCPSPFLRMSFESTCTFLTKAAQEGQSDNLQSPSARIVLGTTAKVGTGCFDLMLPLTGYGDQKQ